MPQFFFKTLNKIISPLHMSEMKREIAPNLPNLCPRTLATAVVVVVSAEEKINQAIISTEEKINSAVINTEEKINSAVINTEEKINSAVINTEEKINSAVINTEEKINQAIVNTENELVNQAVISTEEKINSAVISDEEKINQAIVNIENESVNQAVISTEEKINQAIVNIENESVNQAVISTEEKINQAIVNIENESVNQTNHPKVAEVATPFSEKIYVGRDIHAYTRQVNKAADKYKDIFVGQLDVADFETILREMSTSFGVKTAFVNLRNVFYNGAITDPDVPFINVAILLQKVWNQVKESEKTDKSSSSFRSHFNQTLDDIGMTCIQGISHRLLIDFVAFCSD
jgi:hypothetical protein